MQFDRGYLSAYFCTNSEKMTVELANAIHFTGRWKDINDHDLLPLLQTTGVNCRQFVDCC